MSWIKQWLEHLEADDNTLEPGLYVVATPIGNLEDITLRALRVLQQADLVAAEDTRSAQNLLRTYGLHQPTISLYRDNEEHRIPQVLQALGGGKRIALISEAGTPCISDPGYLTVKAVVEAGFTVFAIPGASAVVAALSAAGLPTHHFIFLGFLPQRRGKRRKVLQTYKHLPATLVLYASPHGVEELLIELRDVLGNRQACIGREITKKFEEFVRGPISSLQQHLGQQVRPRGEFVVLVEGDSLDAVNGLAGGGGESDSPGRIGVSASGKGASVPALTVKETIEQHARTLLAEGGRTTKLAQVLARQYPSLSRRQAYQLLLKLSEE